MIQLENNEGHAAVCAACPLRVRHIMYHLDESFILEKPLFEYETGTGGKVLLGTIVISVEVVTVAYTLVVVVPVPGHELNAVFAVRSSQHFVAGLQTTDL